MTRDDAIEAIRQILGHRADTGKGLSAGDCAALSKVIQYSGRHEGAYRELVLENLKPFEDEFAIIRTRKI